MWKNYLKLTLRQLRIFKIYSFINIIGLSIGLAASFIILLYILYQISFDRYNEKLSNTYLVIDENKSYNMTSHSTPLILAQTLKNDCPEIEEFARWRKRECKITYLNTVFEENNCVFSDLDIFKILTLPFKYGEINSIKKEKDFLIISETMSKKYFKEYNPVGNIVTIDCNGEKYDLKVSAVMKDIPKTSTFYTDFIAPLYIEERNLVKNFRTNIDEISTSWDMSCINTYILLSPSAEKTEFEKKIVEFSDRHINPNNKILYRLIPLKDIYFSSSNWINNRFPSGSIYNVYIYSAVALLILFIACVNYIMLNMGRASLKTKEIGIRKVIGALRFDLFKQNITEAVVVSLLALPIAILFVEMSLQDLSPLLGIKISSDYFHNWQYILMFFVITVIIGIFAGSYIFVYLSKLNPVNIFKNMLNTGSNKVVFRRILMITQMIIFIGLIFSSVVIFRQMQYFINRDFGFNKEQLAVFYPEDKNIRKHFQTFKNELSKNSDIIMISGANNLPGSDSKGIGLIRKKDNPEKTITIEFIDVDQDFIETMEMKMISGTSFKNVQSGKPGDPNEKIAPCIFNESALREIGFKSLAEAQSSGWPNLTGVVKDFNIHSLHEKIGPISINLGTNNLREIIFRLKPGNIPNTIKFIQEKSKEFNNGKPMEFDFFDDRLKDLYTREQNFQKVIGYATSIAIFIACLGIFGISVLICQQRVKETGIRKILGASGKSIYFILTKEYFVSIILSSIIAFPLSYYLIDKWLQNFAYKTDIDLWTFFLSDILALLIVFITVSIKAIKTVRANPVEALRYE